MLLVCLCSTLSLLAGGIDIGFVSSPHICFTVTGLSVDLIASPPLLGYCGTLIALVTAHGAALLLLLPIITDLVAFGSRTAGTAPRFKKVNSETAKTHLMKALPSEAGMQEALSCRRRGGVAEVL